MSDTRWNSSRATTDPGCGAPSKMSMKFNNISVGKKLWLCMGTATLFVAAFLAADQNLEASHVVCGLFYLDRLVGDL